MANQIPGGNRGVEQKDCQAINQQGRDQRGNLEQHGNQDKGYGKDSRNRHHTGRPRVAENPAGTRLKPDTEPADNPHRMGKPAGIAKKQIKDQGAEDLELKKLKGHHSSFLQIANLR
jgi:hypothetical protein